jgi:hypothetical protein
MTKIDLATTKVLKNGVQLMADGGAIYYHFSVGGTAQSATNVMYITRWGALDKGMDNLYIHNHPHYVMGRDYQETRELLVEFHRLQDSFEDRLPDEKSKFSNDFFRVRLSVYGKLDTVKMRDLVIEHIKETFPKSRAIASIHQDTKNTHVHIHLQARQIDGEKLNLPLKKWSSLDEKWGKTFAKAFGAGKLKQHLDKKKGDTRVQTRISKGRAKGKTIAGRAAAERFL